MDENESIEERAKLYLEKGDLSEFRNIAESVDTKFNYNMVFSDGGFNFPIVLTLTYRKFESMKTGTLPVPTNPYCHCLAWLYRRGANPNHQDNLQRTIAHWTILTQTPFLLVEALKFGCDPRLQDSEGQTILHLCIRAGNPHFLDIISQHITSADTLDTPSSSSGATPLIYAVQIGSFEIAKLLLEKGASPNVVEVNKYKRSALHYAMFTNRPDIFQCLMKHGASADLPDYKNRTVTSRAVDFPDGRFQSMIKGEDLTEPISVNVTPVNITPNSAMTSLISLCKAHDIQGVKDAIANGALLYERDEDGKLPLHHCTEHDDTACAELLLNADSAISEMKDNDGFTSLHSAVLASNTELIKLLIANGANLNCTDNENHTVIHWLAVCGEIDTLDLLIRSGVNVSLPDVNGAHPLHFCAQACANEKDATQCSTKLQKLVDAGAIIDCRDEYGRTALNWAASVGSESACKILLAAAADVNSVDNANLTALHSAADKGNIDVLRFLIERCKANVDCVDEHGCTPLFYAVTRGHEECCKILLINKANPDHQDHRARTPAHCSAMQTLTLVKLLKGYNANMWIANTAGEYPVHEAVYANNLEIVSYLLSMDSEKVNTRIADGRTMLHIAAEKNYTEMCKLLIKYHGDVNDVYVNETLGEMTPMDVATDRKCIDVLRRNCGLFSRELDSKRPNTIRSDGEYSTGSLSRSISRSSISSSNSIPQNGGSGTLSDSAQSDSRQSVKPVVLAVPVLGNIDTRAKRPPVHHEQNDLKNNRGVFRNVQPHNSNGALPLVMISNHPSKPNSRSSSRNNHNTYTRNVIPSKHVQRRDTESIPSSDSTSLPDVVDDDRTSASSSPFERPLRRATTVTPRYRRPQTSRASGRASAQLADRVTSSVRDFEALRKSYIQAQRTREMKLHNGYVSDSTMLLSLMDEYKKSLMLHEADMENHGGYYSDHIVERRDYSQNSFDRASRLSESDDIDFRAQVRETRDLFHRAQRNADDTLRMAKRVNSTLEEEYRRNRINNGAMSRRPPKSAKLTAMPPTASSRATTALTRKSVSPNRVGNTNGVDRDNGRHKLVKAAYLPQMPAFPTMSRKPVVPPR